MSKVEVNTVEPQCGTTLTLGGCGQTVALGSGASQTGFGRTGTVDWDTSIKTSTVTAVTGKGYFVDTTLAGITVNLPAGAAGSIVAVSDYASTAATYNITVNPNGSDKINGVNDDYTISTAGLAVTLVYADATRGWKSVTGSDADATGEAPAFVVATGGTPCAGAVVDTDYKTHTFTAPGTLTVSCGGNALGSNTVDYLVVAGGGGGSRQHSGGGGGGGYRTSYCAPATISVPVTATPYPIGVGGGGAAGGPAVPGVSGTPSTFDTITSTAGGGGGGWSGSCNAGLDGGSGGGGSASCLAPGAAGGSGNTPAIPVGVQGYDGGIGFSHATSGGGGGGGGGAVGADALTVANAAGAGGAGAQNNIDGNNYYWAGGGGGGNHYAGTPTVTGLYAGPGGIGGGAGGGSTNPSTPALGGGSAINSGGNGGNGDPGATGGDGGDNSGGGGGSSGSSSILAGSGGSGIVIIRYKFQ